MGRGIWQNEARVMREQIIKDLVEHIKDLDFIMRAKGGNQRFEAGSSTIKFACDFSAQQPIE